MITGVIAMLLVGAAPTVKVEKTTNGWQLLRNGKPYVIRGVGGTGRMDELVAAGGNSMRTWGSEKAAAELDECHKRGLTLTLGVWLGHRQHMNWDDPAKVQEQFERVRRDVEKYKDHPALLIWGLGNEMEVDGNDRELVWRAIEDIAKMCKKLDPNHPTMTVVAELSQQKIDNIKKYAPSIDILGVNSYGGLPTMPKRLKEYGWEKPYIVTEFGPLGPWERPKTPWGAALEQTSTEKAEFYRKNYEDSILGQKGWCFGSYAFLWGDKQEETPTWFGMFLPTGERTEAIDVMTQFWTGKPAANRAPRIQGLELSVAQKETDPGTVVTAEVKAVDPDQDRVSYRWEVRREATNKRFAGEGEQRPGVIKGLLEGVTSSSIRFAVPKETGAYRLYVTATDGKGSAAVANIPFAVK